MSLAFVKSWVQDRVSRLLVCALLIPLLLLSSFSFDVFVTHAHDGQRIHTHASRTLSTRHLHQHHDSAHDHHHSSVPNPSGGQSEEPAEAESEATVVISSAENLIRQNRHTTNPVQSLMPAALHAQSASLELISSSTHVRTSSRNERPTSVVVLRSTVLLI